MVNGCNHKIHSADDGTISSNSIIHCNTRKLDKIIIVAGNIEFAGHDKHPAGV